MGGSLLPTCTPAVCRLLFIAGRITKDTVILRTTRSWDRDPLFAPMSMICGTHDLLNIRAGLYGGSWESPSHTLKAGHNFRVVHAYL